MPRMFLRVPQDTGRWQLHRLARKHHVRIFLVFISEVCAFGGAMLRASLHSSSKMAPVVIPHWTFPYMRTWRHHVRGMGDQFPPYLPDMFKSRWGAGLGDEEQRARSLPCRTYHR